MLVFQGNAHRETAKKSTNHVPVDPQHNLLHYSSARTFREQIERPVES
jgi:hypothetical protein